MNKDDRPSSNTSTDQEQTVIASVHKLLEIGEEVLNNSCQLWRETGALFSLELELAKRGFLSMLLSLLLLVFVLFATLVSLEILLVLALNHFFALSWLASVALVFLLNIVFIDQLIRRFRRAKKDLGFHRLRALWKGLKS